MARARNIKPSFFMNEELAELPYQARLLFIGLWCLADREGLLEDRPKKIKMGIFPADSLDVDPLLNQLAERDFIQRYESEGLRCICVKNFRKHQNPHCNEASSTLPKPCASDSGLVQTQGTDLACMVQVPGVHQASTVQAPGEHDASPADSLIPDSLIPEAAKPLCDESHGEVEKRAASASFERFWIAFDDKRGKSEALKAWKRIKPCADLAEQIIAAAERYAAFRAAVLLPDGQKPKMAQGWLSGERWTDELPVMKYTPEQVALIDVFNRNIGMTFPEVSVADWTVLRASKINAALNKWPPGKWGEFFAWVRDNCVFGFAASFDWLISPDGFAAVKAGTYQRGEVV